MKILLVAYEFPPSASPQSLRWTYLSRELALLGHEVHVLAPDTVGTSVGGLPELPSGVVVHRTFAGPVMGLVRSRSKRSKTRQASMGSQANGSGASSSSCGDTATAANPVLSTGPATLPVELNWKGHLWHAGLNWKGRMFEMLKKIQALVTFPDARGEWEPYARRRLDALVGDIRPDVVISSHEPATTLRLGLRAKKRGVPWVADLGDPVLAPYTPRRWRRASLRLEREVCRKADRVLVTAEAALKLLSSRHSVPRGRIEVLTQGFDDRFEASEVSGLDDLFDPARLELLYTGSFYQFRTADALVEAILETQGVRLSIASISVPECIREAATRDPDRVRVLGFLPHQTILGLQRRADILVSIGNALPDQVPGKIFEYLGAGRPILHLRAENADSTELALKAINSGMFCDNSAVSIRNALARLQDHAKAGGPRFQVSRMGAAVEGFAWSAIASRLEATLQEVTRMPAGSDSRNGKATATDSH